MSRLGLRFRARPLTHASLCVSLYQRAIYDDQDGARKEEIAALGGGDNVFRCVQRELL